jgi:hypothetical protein
MVRRCPQKKLHRASRVEDGSHAPQLVRFPALGAACLIVPLAVPFPVCDLCR